MPTGKRCAHVKAVTANVRADAAAAKPGVGCDLRHGSLRQSGSAGTADARPAAQRRRKPERRRDTAPRRAAALDEEADGDC